MAKNDCWIITERLAGWSIERFDQAAAGEIVDIQGGDETDHESASGGGVAAEQIIRTLKENGYHGEPVMLALGANSCFPSAYTVEDVAALKSRDLLRYEFERFLPFSAEEIIADFVIQDKSIFGVGVPIARHVQLIRSLRFADIRITSICPHSMLTAQALAGESPFEAASENFWMLIDGPNRSELVLLKDRQPYRWLCLPDSLDSAAQALEILHEQESSSQGHNCQMWAVSGCATTTFSRPHQLVQRLRFPVELKTTDPPSGLSSATKVMSRQILDGKVKAWLEFNRGVFSTGDRLANVRSAINYSLTLVSLGILLVMVSLGWQTHRLDRARSGYRKAQEAAFAQLHPGTAIPKGIKMRLQIERKQLLEKQAFAEATQAHVSPVTSLRMLLSSIPSGKAVDVQRIKFQPDGSVDFDAQFANRADAEDLKRRLVLTGFEVSAFPTRYQNDKVMVAGKLVVSLKSEKQHREEQ